MGFLRPLLEIEPLVKPWTLLSNKKYIYINPTTYDQIDDSFVYRGVNFSYVIPALQSHFELVTAKDVLHYIRSQLDLRNNDNTLSFDWYTGVSQWSLERWYKKGDIVQYLGRKYICQCNHTPQFFQKDSCTCPFDSKKFVFQPGSNPQALLYWRRIFDSGSDKI